MPRGLAAITALLLFCTAMSFSPGPNTTLSTALAANGGLRPALRFCLAVPAGWLGTARYCSTEKRSRKTPSASAVSTR